MATNLGTLTLNLLANTGSYIQGLSRAERETSQSTGKMKNAFSNFKSQMNEALNTSQLGLMVNDLTARLGGLTGGLLNVTAAAAGMAAGGSIIAAAGLTTLAIQTAKLDAELAVLANRANVSVVSFQILDYAARNLGMTQDGLAQSLADAQEKLGEFTATGGGGEAADFFQALKNNTKMTDDQIKAFAKTLQGKDGVEALQIMKNKLDEVGASSQEQRFIFESLGNDLGNLLPLFGEGGKLLAEYGTALEDAGVIKTQQAIHQSQILAAQTQAVNLQFQGAKSELIQGFTPALVSVADALFGTSQNGIQLQSVGEGLGTIFKSLASVGIGLSAVVQGVGDGFGALAAMAVSAASGDIKGAVAIYKDSELQFSKIIDDSNQRLDRLWAKTSEGKNVTGKLTNAILQLNQAQAATSSGLKVNTKDADDNAKAKDNLAKAASNASKEMARLAEQQYRDREQIYYKYASREMKIQHDLQKEILKIQNANFSPKDSAGYIHNAQMRSDLEIQLYQAQLDAELNDWKSTEQDKLNQKVYINELLIQLDADMNDKQKQLAMRSLIDRSNQELAWIKLEQAQRISDAGDMLRTDLQNMEIKYAAEREKIKLNTRDAKELQSLLALSYASEDHQKRQNLNIATAAWGGTFSDLNGTGAQYQIEQDRFSKYDESQALFDAQMALADSAAEREAIWQAHNERMLLIDQDYEKSKIALGAQSASQTLSSMSDLMGLLLGEQSAGYKAMFAMSKAFAVAQAIINAPKTFSDVYASVAAIPYIGPFLAPVMAGAAVAVQLAQVAQIKSTNMQGFATGGHITGKGTSTSDDIPIWASNGEFMIRAAAVEKLGLANLDYINRTGMLPPRFATGGLIGKEKYIAQSSRSNQSGGVNVVINVPAGYTANESRDGNGNVTIDVVRREIADSWNNLNRANSSESRVLQSNFSIGRNR
ncbi:hypothetical protein ACNPMW_10160 [Acinetobacter junii]|uniref:hypothetical protein n=1 Tax=Acinetobacter junii TaxID=40215 RepID=UPI003AA80FD8